jgi:hypothetical protein
LITYKGKERRNNKLDKMKKGKEGFNSNKDRQPKRIKNFNLPYKNGKDRDHSCKGRTV